MIALGAAVALFGIISLSKLPPEPRMPDTSDELIAARAKGLITDDELRKKRAEILSTL